MLEIRVCGEFLTLKNYETGVSKTIVSICAVRVWIEIMRFSSKKQALIALLKLIGIRKIILHITFWNITYRIGLFPLKKIKYKQPIKSHKKNKVTRIRCNTEKEKGSNITHNIERLRVFIYNWWYISYLQWLTIYCYNLEVTKSLNRPWCW